MRTPLNASPTTHWHTLSPARLPTLVSKFSISTLSPPRSTTAKNGLQRTIQRTRSIIFNGAHSLSSKLNASSKVQRPCRGHPKEETPNEECDNDPFSPSYKSSSFFHNTHYVEAEASPLDDTNTSSAISADLLSAEMLASTLFHTFDTRRDAIPRQRTSTAPSRSHSMMRTSRMMRDEISPGPASLFTDDKFFDKTTYSRPTTAVRMVEPLVFAAPTPRTADFIGLPRSPLSLRVNNNNRERLALPDRADNYRAASTSRTSRPLPPLPAEAYESLSPSSQGEDMMYLDFLPPTVNIVANKNRSFAHRLKDSRRAALPPAIWIPPTMPLKDVQLIRDATPQEITFKIADESIMQKNIRRRGDGHLSPPPSSASRRRAREWLEVPVPSPSASFLSQSPGSRSLTFEPTPQITVSAPSSPDILHLGRKPTYGHAAPQFTELRSAWSPDSEDLSPLAQAILSPDSFYDQSPSLVESTLSLQSTSSDQYTASSVSESEAGLMTPDMTSIELVDYYYHGLSAERGERRREKVGKGRYFDDNYI